MNFQTAVTALQAETAFRIVQNSITATTTITAGTIALHTPVVLETATNSLPSTVATYPQNFINKPATSTSKVNNLFVGVLAAGPRSDYLEREAVGLAQCYGPHIGVILQRETAGAAVGSLLIPSSLGNMIPVDGPVTAAATGTAANVEVPGMAGLAYLVQALGTSSATETTTGIAFIRAL